MNNKTVGKYVVILAHARSSNKWLFVKKDGELTLPRAKFGLLNKHPIIRAVKCGVAFFGDLTNIEISFELKGEDCTVIIYNTIFEFQKTFDKIESVWLNPVEAMATDEIDDFSKQIVELMLTAYQKIQGNKNKATKDHPLEFKL